MVSFAQINSIYLIIVVVVGLVSCSNPQLVNQSSSSDINITRRIEIYTAGYRNISEKYIRKLNVSDIAFGGIQGLASIDPALKIERDDPFVRLLINGKEIAFKKAPEPMDSRGWGFVTTHFERTATQYSRLIEIADEEKIYEAVFDGVVANLDVFSRYAGPAEAEVNRARREGFSGIGIEFNIKSGKPVITNVQSNMPAALGGLRVNDQITHIDGSELFNLTKREIAKRLQGSSRSKVVIRIYRAIESRHLEITMARMHIVPKTVTTEITDDFAYIKISGFNQGTADSMEKVLQKIRRSSSSRLNGLIIDLRGNPGGLLKQSIRVADLLLSQGHIVSTRGRHPDSLHQYEASGQDFADGWRIVVLVDGKSASASEIVAAALQDRGRAVVVGTASYGKGTVQTVIRLPNNGELNLTWSRFIAPSGYALQGLGVRPAICTSQLKNSPQQALVQFLSNKLETRSTLASWRQVSLYAKKARKVLRETCAAEQRETSMEKEIGKILLANPQLFFQALELADTKIQALK